MTETHAGALSRIIVVVGQTFPASRTPQRTKAMRALGHAVRTIPITPEGTDYETPPSMIDRLRYRLRVPADPAMTNKKILSTAASADILWLEAADMVRVGTLRSLKAANPSIAIIGYSEDDMLNPRNRTVWQQQTLPLIDLWATTKSLNIRPEEQSRLRFRNMFFVNNSYDPGIHRPIDVTSSDASAFGGPVSFIGSYETPRARSMLHLAQNGLAVRIWGNGWERMKNRHPNLRIEGRPAYNDEFAKVVANSAVNVCFLRHTNRDLQTCRSIEIPACAGFMLHERNREIQALLRESREAVYFSDDNELLEACRDWLGRDSERRSIAINAHHRVEELALRHQDNISRILEEADRLRHGNLL